MINLRSSTLSHHAIVEYFSTTQRALRYHNSVVVLSAHSHYNFFIVVITFSSSPHLPVSMATSWETPERIQSSSLSLSSAPAPRYLPPIALRGQTYRRAGRVAPPNLPNPRCPSTWSAPPTSCTNRAESSSRFPKSWPHWRARTRAAKAKARNALKAQVEFLSTQIHAAWVEWPCNNKKNSSCRTFTVLLNHGVRSECANARVCLPHHTWGVSLKVFTWWSDIGKLLKIQKRDFLWNQASLVCGWTCVPLLHFSLL